MGTYNEYIYLIRFQICPTKTHIHDGGLAVTQSHTQCDHTTPERSSYDTFPVHKGNVGIEDMWVVEEEEPTLDLP